MERAMPPRPHILGPRARANDAPRVLILSEDEELGVRLRSELRSLLAEPWFDAYGLIDDYHASINGDVIYDVAVYCSKPDEKPEAVRKAIDRIKLFCPEPEMQIVLYSAIRYPADDRIVAIVNQPNVMELADTIGKLLRPAAA